MKACPDRQEILCLDVHGELSPEMHLGLQKHLESCAGCREERSRLLKMLQRVREAICKYHLEDFGVSQPVLLGGKK